MDDGSRVEIQLSRLWCQGYRDPLDERGWAFQERVLSPRLLQYSDPELVWTCQTTPFKLTNGGGRSLGGKQRDARLPARIFDDMSSGKVSSTTVRDSLEMWKFLVQEFTKGRLTYSEDRIPAFAGIVAELKNVWNDDYILGLWKSCIIPLLAWVSNSRDDRKSSRAPSWSWLLALFEH